MKNRKTNNQYIKETLEENLRVPLAEDLIELSLLIKELEKGVNTLLVPIDGISLPRIERNEQQEQASRAFIS